jgi:NitT/TauT family transport system substrate-binding protein
VFDQSPSLRGPAREWVVLSTTAPPPAPKTFKETSLMASRPSPARRPGGGRRLLVLAAVSALAVLTSGCGPLTGSSAQSGGHTPINVGIIVTVDGAPVKLAQVKGYFAEQGLNANVKVYPSVTQTMPAVRSGEIDVALMNYVSFFQATAVKTLDAKVVSDAYQGTRDSLVLLAKPDSGIRGPKDLAGKKVSVHAKGNIVELLIRAVLQDNGVGPNSVSYLEAKFPQIPAAIANGQIDAGGDLEPYITQGEQKFGLVPTFKIVTGSTDNIPLSGYVATTKFINAHPDTVAAFQRAMVKAQKAAVDRAAVSSVLPDLTGVDKQTSSLLKLGVYPTSVDATRLQRVVTLMKTYGYLQQSIDVSSLVVPTPNS